MRNCTRCLLPETQETITYDEEGVCNVCKQNEYKKEKVDWVARKKEFESILENHRGKYEYDCIVPFSGGKDSTFTLYHLVKEYKLKPLVVCFDHGFLRPQTVANTEMVVKKLGVDFLKFRPNWQIVKKLMLESLKRKGDFCWHCHVGIFSYPMQIAVKFKVPLLIWGEPSAEYTSYYDYSKPEEVDELRFNKYVNLGITAEDMEGMLNDTNITLRDLEPFRYPSLESLRAIKCRSICLGSFMPWDTKNQSDIIAKELGWKGSKVEGIPESYYYEKVECYVQGVRDYLKYIKRGFGRTSHLMSLDLRNKRITVDEAKKLIEKYDGKRPASLDVFLKYVGLTEDEFNELAARHVVSPHVFDPKKIKKGDKLPDYEQWDKTI
ncbi:MAG: N-acetyl sugar amidotransferase [Candidatus Micrarchaeota archaeon]